MKSSYKCNIYMEYGRKIKLQYSSYSKVNQAMRGYWSKKTKASIFALIGKYVSINE